MRTEGKDRPAASAEELRVLNLRQEVERIIDEARTGARRAQRRSKLWNATHLTVGFPAAVLAGISGAIGLASANARGTAAALALLSAGLVTGASFLRADAHQMVNLQRRYAWQKLEARARLVLAYEGHGPSEKLHAALLTLLEMRASVPTSALVLAAAHADARMTTERRRTAPDEGSRQAP